MLDGTSKFLKIVLSPIKHLKVSNTFFKDNDKSNICDFQDIQSCIVFFSEVFSMLLFTNFSVPPNYCSQKITLERFFLSCLFGVEILRAEIVHQNIIELKMLVSDVFR